MNDISHQLNLPCRPKPGRLRNRFVNANDYITNDDRFFTAAAIVECNNVGRAFVPQILFVQRGDLACADELQRKLVLLQPELFDKQPDNDCAEKFLIEFDLALPASDAQDSVTHVFRGVLRRQR